MDKYFCLKAKDLLYVPSCRIINTMAFVVGYWLERVKHNDRSFDEASALSTAVNPTQNSFSYEYNYIFILRALNIST